MKKIYSLTLSVMLSIVLKAQVGIGTTDPKATLDINSFHSGILIPRVTNSDQVTATSKSMLLWDESENRFEYYNGTSFVPLGNQTLSFDREKNELSISNSDDAINVSSFKIDATNLFLPFKVTNS
ncbi:MAG: hypothetical protein ACK5MD_11305, partial [Flavobacteriales bacterium]